MAGGLLGHALTPTHTKVIEHQPTYMGGGGGGGGGGSNGNGEDRIIIINNGPAGSVTADKLPGGTTVIQNNPSDNASPQAPTPNLAQPAAQSAPLAPLQPVAPVADQNPPALNSPTNANIGAAGASAAIGAAGAGAALNAATSAGNTPVEQAPPTGGIICVPMKVPEMDPNDNTKTIEVEKTVCYPAPAPAPAQAPATAPAPAPALAPDPSPLPASVPTTDLASIPAASSEAIVQTTSNTVPSVSTSPLTLDIRADFENEQKTFAPLASINTTPLYVPEGSVALAPLNPGDKPDVIKISST